ncbi:MAG: LysR family transcriptional regulator [Lachnospiraceae bacterium]|nr:LysR family transcriptional regulator [Lachnospiraceae bacterium]
MNQNLNHYKVFYTVAKYKNISKAADALFISQPAISKTLSKLEENLGCSLFHRTSRGVTLTTEGQILYERIREAFQVIDSGEEEIRHINELGIGQIRIGVSTTLCKYILLPYLQDFIKEHPHIKITIECQSTLHTIEMLENGSIDIGLIGVPKNKHSIIFNEIKQIQDTFVATQTYLDNLSIREQDQQDLFSSANLMLLDEENITRQYINDYFYRNQIKTNQVLEVSSMDLLIEFAKIGLGVACVIREFVNDELNTGHLVELPIKNPIEARSVGFAYSKSHAPSKATMQFLNYILQ